MEQSLIGGVHRRDGFHEDFERGATAQALDLVALALGDHVRLADRADALGHDGERRVRSLEQDTLHSLDLDSVRREEQGLPGSEGAAGQAALNGEPGDVATQVPEEVDDREGVPVDQGQKALAVTVGQIGAAGVAAGPAVGLGLGLKALDARAGQVGGPQDESGLAFHLAAVAEDALRGAARDRLRAERVCDFGAERLELLPVVVRGERDHQIRGLSTEPPLQLRQGLS